MDDTQRDLRATLVPLVKLALAGEAAEATGWRAEAAQAQAGLAGRETTTLSAALTPAWSAAVKAAGADGAVRRDETVNPTLPTTSPIDAASLAASPFDLDGAVALIRDTASFG